MKYLIKQLVGAFATPLSVALFIGLVAGVLRISGRRRVATGFVVLAAAVAYLGALSPVGDALLTPLERRYPPLNEDTNSPSITAIVVLGSGYAPRDGIPVTGALDEDGLSRVVEGVRLARRYQNTRLIVSGGASSGLMPSAIGYATLAHDLGIPDTSVVILDKSLDTGDEAQAVAQLLGPSQFLLVTSAYHMPRAMRLLERAGSHPIAAPTGYRAGEPRPPIWRILLPTAGALRNTDRALHEYLGLAAIRLGQD